MNEGIVSTCMVSTNSVIESGDRKQGSGLAHARISWTISSDYRADIDGLRSLAILPIILLHCGIHWLKGGFIGVDIFFVISGYLITKNITRDIDAGHFTFVEFYRRRAVRILPSLGLMMVVTLCVGCWLLFPRPLRDLGWSALATSLFVSNGYFFETSDYFASASDTLPLIHCWSLAVEEQFYLLYPLFLLAIARLGRRHQIMWMVCLALLSLISGGILANTVP